MTIIAMIFASLLTACSPVQEDTEARSYENKRIYAKTVMFGVETKRTFRAYEEEDLRRP